MSTRKTPAKPNRSRAASPAVKHRRIRSLLTRPLGLLGWEKLEPVLLAALTTKEPLLLIGRHGTAKSFLLERLAQALGLVYRFYNASLINYDDLVGIPLPDETQTSLRYITTPTAIWDAEVVFVDEINRTRPDLQNKLFPIIHERRVQGVDLEKLRYRWAAMNPAANGEQDKQEQYLGAEPLDPALADRFGFLIEVPDWSDLSEAERTEVLLDQFRGPHEFPVQVPALVERSAAIFRELCARPPAQLCGYFLALESQLRSAGSRFSSRRMTTLLRTSLGIHASRIALCIESGEKSPKPEWQESLFLALAHGHPGLASGPVDRGALLALHRQAWNIAGLNEDDPWKELLKIADPVERAAVASKTGFPLTEADLSSVILEAVASRSTEPQRAAVALVLYLSLRTSRRIAATAAETLASQLSRVLRPFTTTHQVYGKELQAAGRSLRFAAACPIRFATNTRAICSTPSCQTATQKSPRRSCTASSSGCGNVSASPPPTQRTAHEHAAAQHERCSPYGGASGDATGRGSYRHLFAGPRPDCARSFLEAPARPEKLGKDIRQDNPYDLRETIRARWPSPDDLFAQIGEPKPLPVQADFLIGRRVGIYADGWLLCPDPQIVAGVQARCSGNLYLSRRSPDLSWERLLSAPIAFDEPAVSALFP